MEMDVKGKLITFEGSEGSGKSTQIKLICHYLKRKNKSVVFLREPGGVPISEKIRRILLDVQNSRMSDECEILLYMAARAQLVDQRIQPALKQGQVVLCDRFLDSTVVYQGFGNGIDIGMIKKIGKFATQGVKPDLTFIFDIETRTGLSRIKRAKDRIERRAVVYHNRVRKGYRRLAGLEPKRIKLIRVNKSKEEIHQVVRRSVDHILGI